MKMVTDLLMSTRWQCAVVINGTKRFSLSFPILPGVQRVRPLVSGDNTLHGKGPQNDQQQAGNFGVHSLIFTAKENRNYNFYSILSYFDHIYKI